MGVLDLPGQLAPFGYPASVDPITARATDVSTVGGANQGLYYRVRDGGTISKVAVEVTTQNGNICVAAYRNSGAGRSAVPGTRLATSGAVTCPAVGYQEISLGATITLNPGDWLAVSSDSATAAFRSLITSEVAINLATGRCYKQGSAHPLPSTPASLNAILGRAVVLVGTP